MYTKFENASSLFCKEYCEVDASKYGSYDAMFQAFVAFVRHAFQPYDFDTLFHFNSIRVMFETMVHGAGGTVHDGRLTISGMSLLHWPRGVR